MSKAAEEKPLRFGSTGEWARWLEKHHASARVAWVVFMNKGNAKKRGEEVPYDAEMIRDEALCWGWVDSLMKKIDEREYMVKYTPRKDTSTWSDKNKKRVEELTRMGRMRESGMRCVEVAKKNGMWEKGVQPPEVDDSLPGALLAAFQENPLARDGYFGLPGQARKYYNIWINMARRPETVQRRLKEALLKLERGEELGLK